MSRWRVAKEHLTVLSSLCQHKGLVHGIDMKRRIKVFFTSMIGFWFWRVPCFISSASSGSHRKPHSRFAEGVLIKTDRVTISYVATWHLIRTNWNKLGKCLGSWSRSVGAVIEYEDRNNFNHFNYPLTPFDEGLTLETPALLTLSGGQFTSSTRSDKAKLSCYTPHRRNPIRLL